MTLEFHHVCHRIAPGKLEAVLELFDLLGCGVTYRPEHHQWAMVGQPGTPIDIQLYEEGGLAIPTEQKLRTHVAFLSDDPARDVAAIETWAKKQELRIVTGGWSEQERWFDLPEVFGDFVVEIMDRAVVEE